MIEWIIGIGGIVFGSGCTASIQFFISRHDKKNQEIKEALGRIINELSSFGQALHIALDSWYDNYRKLNDLLDSHIKASEKYNKFFKNFISEFNVLFKKNKECFCKFAPTCPQKLEGELPQDIQILLQSECDAENEHAGEIKKIEKGYLEILDDVTKSISNYKDFLNHIPDVYKISKSLFNIIYPVLLSIDNNTTEISNSIHSIKSDPLCIGESKTQLGKKISNTLHSIELAKLTISKELNNL